jgi:DnaJ-related protein SCJ1
MYVCICVCLQGGGGGGGSPFDMFFGGGQQQGGRRKGPNYDITLPCTLEELYNGAEKEFTVRRNVICKGCHGTGAEGGKEKKCRGCDGKGTRLQMQRLGIGFNVQMQTTCDKCGGRGKTAAKQCTKCSGQKVVEEDKTLNPVIEKGMPDGHELIFERASQQEPGVSPGDVVMRLKTKKHKVFTRSKNDLKMDLKLTLKEALLGFKKEFTHLDGRTVVVERDAVTQPMQVMKMKGEGMPLHNYSSEKGVLYVRFVVKNPTKLSAEQKKVLGETL